MSWGPSKYTSLLHYVRMDTKLSKFLTTKEVADLFGLSDETVRSWIQTRRITYIKVGRSVRISEDEVQRLILQGTVMPRREPTRSALEQETAQALS